MIRNTHNLSIFLLMLMMCVGISQNVYADKDPDRTSYTITSVANTDGDGNVVSYTVTANVPDDYGVVYWFSMDGAAGMEPGTEDDYLPGDLRRGQTNNTYHHYGKYWEDRQFYLVNGARMNDTDKVLVGKGKSITINVSDFAKYGKAFRYQAYQSEDDALNHTKDLTKVYTNFISFGNVVYVDTDNGSDSNDGLSINTPKLNLSAAYTLIKSLHSSNPCTMNSNVVVLRGSSLSHTDVRNYEKIPFSITSRYADYTGSKGVINFPMVRTYFVRDIKFENIKLTINRTYSQAFNVFDNNGTLMVFGAGIVQFNFGDHSNTSDWGTVGCTVPSLCINSQKDSWAMSLTNQEKSTYNVNSFPTGSEVYLLSGYYGRILGAGRSDQGTPYTNNRRITGVYNHPCETKIVFDIDNSFYTETEKSKVVAGSKVPSCDVGFLAGGMANGSCFQICDFEVKRGHIHRFVTGGVGNGGTDQYPVDHHPTDSYFGKSTLNMYGGSIDELFGGTMGRFMHQWTAAIFYRGFFYGESTINIYGGTVNNNIYSAGCGGTSGVGNDNSHTNDLAIPYYRGSTDPTLGSVAFGSYKEYKNSGYAMPNMTSHFFAKNENGSDYVFNLADSKSSVTINGGTVKGSIYGGGYGYSPYLEIGNYASSTYLAGCFFGNTYVNISSGTINGKIYGGGAGTDSYNDNLSSYAVPNNNYYPYDDDIRAIINAGKFFNHDALGRVFGDTHVNISGNPTITGDIYAGAAGINSKSTYRKTTNASYNHADNPYKEMAMVIGNTNLSITGSPTIKGNIYGGGESASVTGNTNMTISGTPTITGTIFGGGQGIDETHVNTSTNTYIVAANVGGSSNINITGGSVSGDVFGCNNYFGEETGDNTVVTLNGGKVGGNIYGGGNLATYTPTDAMSLSPAVKVQSGEVTGSVFGGGYGATAVVTANPQVSATGGTVTKSLFGGGELAEVVGNPSVTVNGGTVSTDVYGGGSKAVVTGNTSVTLASGTVTGNIYGGGLGDNTSGSEVAANVSGTTHVTINGGKATNVFGCNNKNGAPKTSATVTVSGGTMTENVYGGGNLAAATLSPEVTVTGGTMQDVFGAGLGTTAVITGNPVVNINKAAEAEMSINDVYGGGSKAVVTGNTTVTLTSGTVTGNIYGGGLGDNTSGSEVAANVSGTTHVTINGGKATKVFGCNNLYGAPTGVATVDVNGTDTPEEGQSYTITGVFGGGDQASYSGTPVVNINSCNASIEGVYGGGNAADVVGTNVTIWGGDINNAFAGGNGVVSGTAANVSGNAMLTIHGGTINHAYAGSNNNGTISGTQTVAIDKAKNGENDQCNESITEVYGGGNKAAGQAGTISIDCTAENIGDVYGGANQADITTPITLNITKGKIARVFGGNNTSGNIPYPITVNINKDADCDDFSVDYVYGGGNKANYTAPASTPDYPQVNVLAGTVTNDVFGGGLEATVSGNPTVVINGGTVGGSTYGGGSLAGVTGDTHVTLTTGTVTGNIYGGGLGNNTEGSLVAANVSGTTNVAINGGTASNVFGCNNLYGAPQTAAKVGVTGGTVSNNVYGGGNLAAATISPEVTMNGGTATKVFGGGLGTTAVITGDPSVTIEKTAETMTVTDVFGGGDAAEVVGNPTVDLKTGTVTSVFGGGNQAAVTGTTTVNEIGATVTNIYAGGNGDVANNKAADINGTAKVTVSSGTVSEGVYGGCNALGTINKVSGANGNTVVTINGGNIGTSTAKANIHGGGYGEQTNVEGDVDVTINETDATNKPLTIYADVYGGSALGQVNGTTVNSTNHTKVSLTGGTLNGDIYGGGLGSKNGVNGATTDVEAKVWSPVTVEMFNATLNGNIFGCNNLNGAPQSTVAVTVSKASTVSDGVYGGGNKAAYGGTPTVTISDCNYSIGSVYGGGNAAATSGTNATIWGGNITNAFGGGNGASGVAADVNGNSNLFIYGGHVINAFAGSNMHGNITGDMVLKVGGEDGTCSTLQVDNTYGGGNQAEGKGATITIGCGSGYLGNVYGGAKAAKINGDLVLNIEGGEIDNVFGGNDQSGEITGNITVNIKNGDCATAKIKNVYGGGNLAPFKHNTTVNLINGQVGYMKDNVLQGGNVFGGGYGSTAVVTGNTEVNLKSDATHSFTVLDGIYGGGELADVKGNTTINLTKGTAANVYGGGKQADIADNDTTDTQEGNTVVNLAGASITTGIYGGSNTSGTVSDSIKVNITGGIVGTYGEDGTTVTKAGNVHGGGYGQNTDATGVATVTLNGTSAKVSGDIYGGSALGKVNDTKVTTQNGIVSGSVYGGGLGSKIGYNGATANVAAIVKGNVQVTIDGGTIKGDVFGCNNLNGSPDSTSTVNVNIKSTPSYRLNAVYGGGNLADCKVTPHVSVDSCNVNISSVYGGGNAAATAGTSTVIWGGDIGNAFGGGNGIVSAANVNGNSSLTIHGGTIKNVFAGSNTSGTISGNMALNIDQQAREDCEQCEEHIDSIYGGGNQAEGKGAVITIGCGSGYLGNVFGGAKAAKINGKLVLNIKGGQIDNVFGGNDQSGEITDSIIVNINTGGCESAYIGNVYGGGNQAPFNHNTQVNLISGKVGYMKDGDLVGGNVFGGGYGARATVSGNTEVNLKSDPVNHPDSLFKVLGSIYGGGDLAAVQGNTTINLTKGTAARIFGGGNKAEIKDSLTTDVHEGNTTIKVNGETVTVGNIYGGGNEAGIDGDAIIQIISGIVNDSIYGGCNTTGTIAGNTLVTLTGGTTKSVFGGGYGKETAVSGNVDVKVGDVINKAATGTAAITGDVYGGSALGNVNSDASDSTRVKLISGTLKGNIYGGGLGQQDDPATEGVDEAIAAKVYGPVKVTLNGGSLTGKVFGCNNKNGAPQSTVAVLADSLYSGATFIGNIYGGGNQAAYTGNPVVTVKTGKIDGNVFGGGLGATAVVTGDPQVNVTGGTVTGTVYGGGDEANVNGGTTVKVTGAQTNVNGSVFGGGNNAAVSGPTNVQVGGN